jgi:hypothetical protein
MTFPVTRPQTGSRLVFLTRWAAWIALALILFLMFAPPALRPVSDLPHALEHLLVFLLTGVAFGIGNKD